MTATILPFPTSRAPEQPHDPLPAPTSWPHVEDRRPDPMAFPTLGMALALAAWRITADRWLDALEGRR